MRLRDSALQHLRRCVSFGVIISQLAQVLDMEMSARFMSRHIIKSIYPLSVVIIGAIGLSPSFLF